eukprot:1154892-Pelagomonas_calceolata.AAC.6
MCAQKQVWPLTQVWPPKWPPNAIALGILIAETMRGSAIRRRGASPGAGTLAADTEGGSNQQGAATQPLLQQEQQQQQEGGRGGPGDRERVEEGGQRMSAVGEELVGRDEATDASES